MIVKSSRWFVGSSIDWCHTDITALVTCVGAGVVDARVVAVVVRGLPAVQLDHAGRGDVDLLLLVSAAVGLAWNISHHHCTGTTD